MTFSQMNLFSYLQTASLLTQLIHDILSLWRYSNMKQDCCQVMGCTIIVGWCLSIPIQYFEDSCINPSSNFCSLSLLTSTSLPYQTLQASCASGHEAFLDDTRYTLFSTCFLQMKLDFLLHSTSRVLNLPSTSCNWWQWPCILSESSSGSFVRLHLASLSH